MIKQIAFLIQSILINNLTLNEPRGVKGDEILNYIIQNFEHSIVSVYNLNGMKILINILFRL